MCYVTILVHSQDLDLFEYLHIYKIWVWEDFHLLKKGEGDV